MLNVLLTVHILICAAMIVLVLLQRSEGGALGMGGGGQAGGLISGRGAANVLTRGTTAMAFVFFATSLALTTLGNIDRRSQTGIEQELGDQDIIDLLDTEIPGLAIPPALDTATPDTEEAASLTAEPEAPIRSGEARPIDLFAITPEVTISEGDDDTTDETDTP